MVNFLMCAFFNNIWGHHSDDVETFQEQLGTYLLVKEWQYKKITNEEEFKAAPNILMATSYLNLKYLFEILMKLKSLMYIFIFTILPIKSFP